jgi:hypothetical protein
MVSRRNISTTRTGGQQYSVSWNSRAFLARVDAAIEEAAQRVAESARRYWTDTEWTPERHPYMTGHERDTLEVQITPVQGQRTTITLSAKTPYVGREEERHHPLRNTLDVTAPKLAPAIRRAMQRGSGSQS